MTPSRAAGTSTTIAAFPRCASAFPGCRRPPEARDHARESLRRRSARDRARQRGSGRPRILRELSEQHHFLPQRQGDFEQARIRRLAAEHRDGFVDLERVAGRACERLGHVGQQRRHRKARCRCRRDHRAREFASALLFRQHGAVAELDVEHERLEPGRELLRKDGRHDERQAVDGRRHVADRVQAPVGRRDAVAGAHDRDARLAHRLAHALGRRARLVTGNRLELVERTARVREPAADDHGYPGAAGREHRPERERDEVADAAGRMLVEHRARRRLRAPVEYLAAVAHGEREGRAFRSRHAAQLHRHRKRADLGIGQAAVGDRACNPCEVVGFERPAVALDADRFLRQPRHGARAPGSSKA